MPTLRNFMPQNFSSFPYVVGQQGHCLFIMSKNLSPREELRLRAVQLRNKGFCDRVIAARLKKDIRWVQRTFRRLGETGSLKDRQRSGRKKKLSTVDIRKLKQKVKGKERTSIRKVAASFKTKSGLMVSKETIRRNLHATGLRVHRKRKSTYLNSAHKEKRVEFATKYRRYDWTKCAFWDETEIELLGPPNRKNEIIWDEKGAEYLSPEPAHPIAYKFGIAMTVHGVTSPVPYTGTIDQFKYQEMVGNIIPEIDDMFGDQDWVWVADKARPYVAKSSLKFLADEVPSVFPKDDWPANSPDENPPEQYFSYLESTAREKNPQTLTALKRVVNSAIRKTTPEMCKNFIKPLPTRLQRIIDRKGGYVYNLSSK